MSFRPIDLDTWERKEHFLHYLDEVTCAYSMTVELDITALHGQRLYPAMLWLLTRTVNDHPAFRMQLVEGRLGLYDALDPSYTIFHPESKTFSVIWTAFDPDYERFLRAYAADTEQYRSATAFCPKPASPGGLFDVSMIPWTTFTSFDLHIYGAGRHLLPIFTMGKAFERGSRRLLPLSIRVHHAVCDGYHVAAFVEDLQAKIDAF